MRRAKTLTFCNVSAFMKDINLKLKKKMFTTKRTIRVKRADNFEIFPTELSPFFELRFLLTIEKTKQKKQHLSVERWHPHAVFLFYL